MTLPVAIAIFMLLALVVYCLSGGADFGAGFWDLFAIGKSGAEQRRLIAKALAPIWEANHVWLIVLVTLLFICFPKAFVIVSIALHLPLTLMLIGIVLRGAAFTFQSYGNPERPVARFWEWVFSLTAVLTPLMLGIILATLTTGRVHPPDPAKDFLQNYLWNWLAPFPIMIGVFTVALFAFLAAVYLTWEAEGALRESFRGKALAAALAVAALAGLCFGLSSHEAPILDRGLSGRWWSLPLQASVAISALGAIFCLWRRHLQAARVFAILQVTLIVLGWAFSQYPFLIFPELRLEEAAASPAMLRAVLAALLVGMVILFPSFVYLFRIFKQEGSQ